MIIIPPLLCHDMCHGFQDFRSYYYIFSSFFVHFANKLLLPPPARQQFPCQFGQIFLYFGSLQQISVQNRDVHLVSFFYAFSREGQECPDLFSRFYWDILSFLPFHSMSLVMVFRHVSAPSPLPAMATCHGPGGRRPALGQFSPLPPSPLCPGPSFSSGPGHTRPSPGPLVLFIKNFACFLRKTSCRMSYLSGAALWYHFVINGPLCPSVGPRTRAGKER